MTLLGARGLGADPLHLASSTLYLGAVRLFPMASNVVNYSRPIARLFFLALVWILLIGARMMPNQLRQSWRTHVMKAASVQPKGAALFCLRLC